MRAPRDLDRRFQPSRPARRMAAATLALVGLAACTAHDATAPETPGAPSTTVAAAAAGRWVVGVTDLRAPDGARCAIGGIRLTLVPPPAGAARVTGAIEPDEPAPLVACSAIATAQPGPLPPAPTPGPVSGQVEGDQLVLDAPGGWRYRIPVAEVSASAATLRGTVQIAPSGSPTTFGGTAVLTRR